MATKDKEFLENVLVKMILIVVALIVGAMSFGTCAVVRHCNLSKAHEQLKSSHAVLKAHYDTEKKRYSDSLVESSKELITQDTMDKAIQDLRLENKQLEKELVQAKSNVRTVTKIKTVTREVVRTERSSDIVKKDPVLKIEEHLKELKDAAGLSVADVRFKTPSSKPWSYKVHPRQYKIDIIQTLEDDKPARIVARGRVVDHKGKEAPLPLLDISTIVQAPPRPLWTWNVLPFNVELYATAGVTLSEKPSFSMGLGLAAHVFKRKRLGVDHWRFLGAMLAINGTMASLTLHPVSWNLGSVVPGLSDVFLTVGIGGAVVFVGQAPTVVPAVQFGIGSTL